MNQDNVVVGIRVQVGVQSTDRSPQYFEILGRMRQMKMAKNRWFDVPFTNEESLQIISQNNKFEVICKLVNIRFRIKLRTISLRLSWIFSL